MTNKPPAVIVDVDGTLCDVQKIRHHLFGRRRDFDAFHAASEHCEPIQETLRWCETMFDSGHRLLVVTARMEKWRSLTSAWIDRHLTRPVETLMMRADNDFRPDFDVKREIHAELSAEFEVVFACDDNPHVIALWNELGIPTKVIPGWDAPILTAGTA